MSHDTSAQLPAPTGLTAKVLDDHTVDLSWNAVATADEYGVYEMLKRPDDTFKEAVPGTSSTRTGLAGGHYRYGVTARRGADESAMSTTVDVQLPALVGGHVDLSGWKLTMPVADPHGPDDKPEEITGDLAAVANAFFSFTGGVATYTAPVQGVTTSGESGATRSELRELTGPHGDWDFGSGTHRLTCTLTCDPTAAWPRPECTVGQIHDEDGTPPIRLAVDLHHDPGALRVFPRGQHSVLLLDGLRTDTVFSYRIEVADGDGTCRIWAVKGGADALPHAPSATFARSKLRKSNGSPTGRSFFKAGAYNLSKIEDEETHQIGKGRSVVRHLHLALG